MNFSKLMWLIVATVSASGIASANGDLVGNEAAVFNWQSAGAGTDSMRGWEFSTNTDVTVTALGVFDHFNPNGLQGSHEVVIWNDNDQIMLQATVPAGTAAEKIFRSRYVEVTPTLLESGQTFVIAAQYVGAANQDWVAHSYTSLEFDPTINFIEGRTLNTTDLVIPTGVTSTPMLGPNFLLQGVPEPTTLPVIGAIAVFGFARLRCRRRRWGVSCSEICTG